MNCPRCANRLPAIVGAPKKFFCPRCFELIPLATPKAKPVRHIKAEPAGYQRHIDHNDCTVRAFAIAAQVDHETSRKRFEDAGRKRGKGADAFVMARVIGRAPDEHPRITLVRWLQAHPLGRWMLCSKSHALAVVDGVVNDLNDYQPRCRVMFAWRIDQEPTTEEPACK
jgi:hypothetical protein